MKTLSPIQKDCLTAILAGIPLGAVISISSPGNFWLGWLKIALYGALLVFGLMRIARRLGADRSLAILMMAAFVVRIGLGLFLYLGLPHLGFDNEVQKAGYVFSDASVRDQYAYQLATSREPLAWQFEQYRGSDQYGGMLVLSALIYLVFSPEIHRPLLIVLWSAFAMTAGLAFLYSAVKQKWNAKVALIAAWVFALYPDGVLLSSSQMREPVLIALTCLLFWLSLGWKKNFRRTCLAMLAVTAVLFAFSFPAAGAALVVVVGIQFVEWVFAQQNRKTKFIGLAVFAFFIGAAALAGWYWLKDGLKYEYYLTQSASGVIQYLLEAYSEKIRYPLITVYGLAQPVLPAALIDPSKPIWQGLAIFRAAGWYFVIPFLVYTFGASLKARENRAALVYISLAFIVWSLVSALRAGGDQWDNPRYRTAFLPWIAILTAWAWQQLHEGRRPWFWRILSIETIFVLVFLNWYLYRQYKLGIVVSFGLMVVLISAFTLVVVIGGLLWDKLRRPK